MNLITTYLRFWNWPIYERCIIILHIGSDIKHNSHDALDEDKKMTKQLDFAIAKNLILK